MPHHHVLRAPRSNPRVSSTGTRCMLVSWLSTTRIRHAIRAPEDNRDPMRGASAGMTTDPTTTSAIPSALTQVSVPCGRDLASRG